MAKKIDGKEYYTFVGLINRMDACRNNKCFSKDIPEKVEFKGQTFKLSEDKKTYLLVAKDRNGAEFVADDLSDWAAAEYGADLSMYLTAFDFVVTPKEAIKVTTSELNLIRYMNMFSDRSGKYVSIESGALGGGFRALYLWDDNGVTNSVDVNDKTFINLKRGVKYNLRDLEVSGD